MADRPPLPKPLVLYDGRCGFCKLWIDYWKQLTGDRVDYAASQEIAERFPEIEAADFTRSVQLALPDGAILDGARAVFTTLGYAGKPQWLWLYENLPVFGAVSELAYRIVAGNRSFFYHATRLTFGKEIAPPRYSIAEWLFLRLLGLVYFFAFLSLAVQVKGLIGAGGITPAVRYLAAVKEALGAWAYFRAPTLFWISSSDTMLRAVCFAGAALGLALMGGLSWRWIRVALYALYLSLSLAGQEFLSFQWDALLLEAGVLAIFLGGSPAMVWLCRWLLFRLTFLSGAVKLLSGDPSWRHFTALHFHYFTQPLPTPVAWYLAQLPEWFQRASTGFVFLVELPIPFLIFAPRRLRHLGAGFLLALQLLIAASGNYAFFNLLTVSLCVFLFDDRAFARWRWVGKRSRDWPSSAGVMRGLRAALAILVLAVSGGQLMEMFGHWNPWPLRILQSAIAPLEAVNTYGLFAVMTTTRPEIGIEGSDDGVAWKDYEFRYKPGDPKRAPGWVAPHQPRLDWQMWFAALGGYQSNPWFVSLMQRLLTGSPDVLDLFRSNPFPRAPPRYVRAVVYDYHFTNWVERGATGDWWKRTPKGYYLPPISLASFREAGD